MKSTTNIEVTTKSHITDSGVMRSTLKGGSLWVFVDFTNAFADCDVVSVELHVNLVVKFGVLMMAI